MKSSLRYVEIVTRILLSLALLIQREDQNPSPPHSSVSVAGTTVQSEIVVGAGGFHVEELGGKTIQESHDKKWYQRLFSWRTSQRAVSVDNSMSKRVPAPGHIRVFIALLWLVCLLK